MIAITVSTLISMPFILRPCKDSLRVIFCYGKKETKLIRYFFIMVLYTALVGVTFFCVVKGYNLEDVLTVISTFTSPLVSLKKYFSVVFLNSSTRFLIFRLRFVSLYRSSFTSSRCLWRSELSLNSLTASSGSWLGCLLSTGFGLGWSQSTRFKLKSFNWDSKWGNKKDVVKLAGRWCLPDKRIWRLVAERNRNDLDEKKISIIGESQKNDRLRRITALWGLLRGFEGGSRILPRTRQTDWYDLLGSSLKEAWLHKDNNYLSLSASSLNGD